LIKLPKTAVTCICANLNHALLLLFGGTLTRHSLLTFLSKISSLPAETVADVRLGESPQSARDLLSLAVPTLGLDRNRVLGKQH